MALFLENFFSPAILFFFLGFIASVLNAELKIPKDISRFMSLYLMIAIGFKGGHALVDCSDLSKIIVVMVVAILIGTLQPIIGHFFLKKTTNLDRRTSIAIATHYGSISMVTFAGAMTFLKSQQQSFDGYIIGVMAIMEAPAIISGLWMIYKKEGSLGCHVLKEVFANEAILLLSGSFIISYLTPEHFDKLKPFFCDPFQGYLCFFLLEMGFEVAKETHNMKKFPAGLIAFGLYMPILGAIVGLVSAYFLNLPLGSGLLFIVLCSSASYIAVPAAMKIAVPDVKASYYIPMTLGITFPFNVIVGIPFYYFIAKLILK
jgi:hypothetical protein